jgi:hypothetical protein
MIKRLVIIIGFILATTFMARAANKDHPNPPAKAKKTAEQQVPFDRARAELEYRQLQTEIHLAETKALYFVIDLRRNLLAFKLQGTTVWSEPIVQVETDSSVFEDFADKFETKDHQLMRHIVGKFLFTANKKTPDSILVIVGQAMNLKPELLQREVPGRFQLTWGDGLSLDVRTDIVTVYKMEPFKKAMEQVKQVLDKPFGETSLTVKMTPDAALTLYRAAIIGLPTMIYPPNK